MNISAIDSSASARLAAMYASGPVSLAAGSESASASKDASGRDPEGIRKAASQFEAIIIRQLLEPSIRPIMSGAMGGGEDAAGGIYGYMLTDALAGNLAQGGGMGLARILEQQLTPPGSASDQARTGQATTSHQLHPLKTS